MRPLPFIALVLAACAAPRNEPAPGPTPDPETAAAANANAALPYTPTAPAVAWPVVAATHVQTPAQNTGRVPVAWSSTPGRAEPRATDLANIRLPRLVIESEPSLRGAMELIEAASGVDVHVWEGAEEALLDTGAPLDVHIERSISVASALDLLTELAGDDVTWAVRDGLVQVGTRDRLQPESRTLVYDVSDLIRSMPSYPGPEINVTPSGGGVDLDEELPEPVPLVQEDMLVELVTSALERELGTDEFEVRIWNGKLVVTYPK